MPKKPMDPEELDRWFPTEDQLKYVKQLTGKMGLTRRRAECFVRFWGYILLKSNLELLHQRLHQLWIPSDWVICTHREAAALFYSESNPGSERAAGLMLDKLAALGLIKKRFDGNTLQWQIEPLPEDRIKSSSLQKLYPDAFDPSSDAVSVANLLATNYNWMNKTHSPTPLRIIHLLRQWASQYPLGMRVLRRQDTLNPVGFCLLYPVAQESEVCFFLSPNKSLHLSSGSESDPITIATPGDPKCQVVFARSSVVDPSFMQAGQCLLLEDAQVTLQKMKQDFPNLCDIQTMVTHPSYEKLAVALGFQRMGVPSRLSIYWMYLALDRFLSLNVKSALKKHLS
jgi:hypothetical protein